MIRLPHSVISGKLPLVPGSYRPYYQKRVSLKSLLFISIFLGLSLIAWTQDANYWSSSYGPAGYFTPGAVIARNKDSGVLFYNPALLVFNKRNAASITGTIYQLGKINIANGAGTGYPLRSSSSDVVPLIAANSITLKRRKPVTFVYAIVHSSVLNITVTQRRDALLNVLSDSYSPGPETFIGQYSYSNRVRETSGLLATGFRLSGKMSMGITAEGRIRSQDYLVDYKSRALMNTGPDTLFPPIVSVQNYYLNENNHMGLRLKLGWAYDITEKQHVGLVITSPYLRVRGSATLVSDIEISNLKLNSIDLSLLANTRQTGLKTKIKSPVSVAAGYSVNLRKAHLYVVTEYFSKVKEYDMVAPGSGVFIRPDTSTNNIRLIRLKEVRSAIWNVGVGASYQLRPSIATYISLRTDFNYANRGLFRNTEGFVANTAYWNNYHLQLGTNIIKRKFNLRSGLLLTYGSTTKYLQDVNYDQPNESNLLVGNPGLTKATNFSVGLMVSYIHNL